MMKSTKHIWNLTQLPKVFIPNTIRSMLMLWHMKLISCALVYFDQKKLKFKSQNSCQFSHFYVNQHFISDAKAELVYVNHTPIICLRNFMNKKVGNKPTFITYISFKSCILGWLSLFDFQLFY